MKPRVSLPCPQEPATGFYLKPDESSQHFPPYVLKIHSNIIFPSTLGLGSGLVPSDFFQLKHRMHISPIRAKCPAQLFPPRFDHPK